MASISFSPAGMRLDDERPDFGINVIQALDANYKDVNDFFKPVNQAFNLAFGATRRRDCSCFFVFKICFTNSF